MVGGLNFIMKKLRKFLRSIVDKKSYLFGYVKSEKWNLDLFK